jgi:hypothetical protein
VIIGAIVGGAVFSYLIIGLLVARWVAQYEKRRWPNLSPDRTFIGLIFLLWPLAVIPLLLGAIGALVMKVVNL